MAYIQVTEDGPKSALIKHFTSEELEKFINAAQAKPGDIIFFGAGEFQTVCNALGQVRLACADKFKLRDSNILAYLWVTDFPLFEIDSEGQLAAAHHPFTAPRDDQFEVLKTNPEKTIAKAYDIILNGHEIGGGSIRIHDQELQSMIFELLKISPEEQEKRFGHLLEAFEYGAPPHGGIAFGFDRVLMVLHDEPNIREVIAFPKDSKGKDLMLKAPSPVPHENIEELGLAIKT